MNRDVSDSIWLGVELMIVASILVTMTLGFVIVNNMSQVMQSNENQVARQREYREWLRYDDKYCYLGDISSLMASKRGTVGINVKFYDTSDNEVDTLEFSNDGTTVTTTDYVNTMLNDKLTALGYTSYTIHSNLVYDDNGSVSEVAFKLKED